MDQERNTRTNQDECLAYIFPGWAYMGRRKETKLYLPSGFFPCNPNYFMKVISTFGNWTAHSPWLKSQLVGFATGYL